MSGFWKLDRKDLPALALVMVMALVCVELVLSNWNRTGKVPAAVTSGRLQSGTELVVVLIGASTCGANEMPGFAHALGIIRDSVESQAEVEGSEFATIGVALDLSLEDGYSFLSEFGLWDEVLIGRSWLNLGAQHFLWGAETEPAIPQVLVLRRTLNISENTALVEREELLTSMVGGDVVAWAEQGANLPTTGRLIMGRDVD